MALIAEGARRLDRSAPGRAPAPSGGPTTTALSACGSCHVTNKVYATTGDTFPRSAPFETVHRGGKLFWFTAASRRAPGLTAISGAQHLFMFAVDPAKVMAGTDGSYTGFYLPFQNMQTSNHIGQWTEKIVGGSQPPPPPPPAPPPPPPAPPAVR